MPYYLLYVLFILSMLGCESFNSRTSNPVDSPKSNIEKELRVICPKTDSIVAFLERIEKKEGFEIGVAALDLTSSCHFMYRPTTYFPMASTYKLPIIVAFMDWMNKEKLPLEARFEIPLSASRKWSPISKEIKESAEKFKIYTLKELIEYALQDSDNAASDWLLNQMGGSQVVMDFLLKKQLDSIIVRNSYVEMLASLRRYELSMEEKKAKTYSLMKKILKKSQIHTEIIAFQDREEDVASPKAYLQFLERLENGNLLGEGKNTFLIETMQKCRTSEDRIKGNLPKGLSIAHKTGTFPQITNDIAIIDLLDGRRLFLVVFIKKSTLRVSENEAYIAEVSRMLYDWAMRIPKPSSGI